MADAYWRYADPRHQHLLPSAGAPAQNTAPQSLAAASGGQPLKRARPADYPDVPGAPEVVGYYPRDEERAGYSAARDTQALNASYERFLRTGQIQSYAAGPVGGSVRPTAAGDAGYPVDDRPMMAAGGRDGRNIGFNGTMPEPPLPPDASNTLFIEGIPTDCERREVSHIFRPFVGFQEVRLVNKEPRHSGGDPILLCFVDFTNAAQAAIAMEALQGEIDKLVMYRYFPNYILLTLDHSSVLILELLLVELSRVATFMFLKLTTVTTPHAGVGLINTYFP